MLHCRTEYQTAQGQQHAWYCSQFVPVLEHALKCRVCFCLTHNVCDGFAVVAFYGKAVPKEQLFTDKLVCMGKLVCINHQDFLLFSGFS